MSVEIGNSKGTGTFSLQFQIEKTLRNKPKTRSFQYNSFSMKASIQFYLVQLNPEVMRVTYTISSYVGILNRSYKISENHTQPQC